MSKEYKKNHFVPEGYLKGFNNQNAKVFRLKLNPKKFASGKFEKTIIEKPPSCFCYQDDLYTVSDEFIRRQIEVSDDYPDKDKFIEKECFKSIENVIGNMIESVENGHITSYEKSILVDFIYISIKRNLKAIEDFKEFYSEERIAQIIDDIAQDNAILEKMNMTPCEARKQAWQMLKNEKRFDTENMGKIMIQNSILSIQSNSDKGKTIFDLNKTRRFSIYEATGNVEFITSNYPAFFLEDLAKNRGIYSLSFVLPLNKRMILCIDGEDKSNSNEPNYHSISVDDNLVDLYNYITLENSNGEVYGSCRKTLERYENKDFQNMQKLRFKQLLNM